MEDVSRLVDKVCQLIEMYEAKIWKGSNDKSAINIVCDNDGLLIYFFINDQLYDSVGLYFIQKEIKIYEYICEKLFVKLFNNIKITYVDRCFLNYVDKPYLCLKVYNKQILENSINIMNMHNDHNIINVDSKLFEDYQQMGKKKRKVRMSTITEIETKIIYTKEILDCDDNE